MIADFGQGCQLTFLVSTQLAGAQSIEIMGDKARLEIIIPFNAPPDQATALTVDHGYTHDGSLARREILMPCDYYTETAEAFALAVLGKQPLLYGIEDAILSMRVLDAIVASERSGAWATV